MNTDQDQSPPLSTATGAPVADKLTRVKLFILLVMTWVFVGAFRLAGAPSGITGGLYQIISGTYTECCGFAGGIDRLLPYERQSFVRLTIGPQSNLATMTFLGQDMQTGFSIAPCPSGDPIPFSFNYGFISSNTIFFHVDPGPPPNSEFWSYSVSNSADALRIDGAVGINQNLCADVPTRFYHSNVVAVLMPETVIRVSEVEFCWNSVSNRIYQAQFRSALTTNAWMNLGSPVTGNGSTNCVTDKVPAGEPQRFYRVLTTH